jgi:hypothetical protein
VQIPRAVWALVAAGTVVRLVLAATTDGQPYDMEVLRELYPALERGFFDVYAERIGPGEGIAWPYPSGFFPLVWLAGAAADALGGGYAALVRLPFIAADAAIALSVAAATASGCGSRPPRSSRWGRRSR